MFSDMVLIQETLSCLMHDHIWRYKSSSHAAVHLYNISTKVKRAVVWVDSRDLRLQEKPWPLGQPLQEEWEAGRI